MKIDIMHMLYTISMILFAFVAALMLTKTLAKYIDKKKK